MVGKAARDAQRLAVTVISRNRATLDELQTYLGGADIDAQCEQTIDDIARGMAPACRALVVFPDDFPWDVIDSALQSANVLHPRVLTIVVTASPKRFETRAKNGAHPTLIIPKPAFGWVILDAIHGRLTADSRAG